ncbi:MAG TPA: HAD-IC family P-type ATPase [Gemmatimonadaceae bacterium]|nr:HAD-IC family P-type ATPase [Gemmatimonadaceae bacterium]
MPPPERPRTPWHTLEADVVLAELGTRRNGLSVEEATGRLERYGPNSLEVAPPASALSILAAQFRSVVALLLVAATALAWTLGDIPDAIAIGAVLLINATLGFVTELRARRAMEALRQLEVPRAFAVRDGLTVEISARELVPGDVIAIESGQSVPADARLIETTELRASEAPLTGESVPVEKTANVVLEADTMLAERTNMVYQATAVVGGTARAVVVGTAGDTEVGRIGALTSSVVEKRTPLELRLDALGRRLVAIALGVAAVVALLGLWRGGSWGLVLQTAIALAIAAVPEGLPAVTTITLAVGVSRMARRRALVRRLPAVETLGSATVVCADKTGTLTAGQMAVSVILVDGREITVTGSTYAPEGEFWQADRAIRPTDDDVLREALRIGATANRAELVRDGDEWHPVGDPTEVALLVAAMKAGLDRGELRREHPEQGEVPFSSERQWMATFNRNGPGALLVHAKGAPGRIIERSARALSADGERPLDDAGRRRLLEENRALAARGLRVLAVAKATAGEVTESAVRDLTFVGLIGISDPPAEGVGETIRTFRDAGVRTVMITGDQRLTAVSVARQLGLVDSDEGALDGRELATLDVTALGTRLETTGVFNRVSPADKLRIVEALQQRGEIVAMLGDGVNDAAALKKADIGVAMGRRGTDIAKEAADVVLADDRFSTVAAAVEEGRVIFDNIRKFVFYLFSCNLAEVLLLLVVGLIGLPQPLLPLQILWLNLVTDTFPALALAVEPAESDVMKRPPRDPDEAILSRSFLGSIVFYAVLIATATLAAFLIALEQSSHERAMTVAFVTLALAQGFHLGTARSANAVLAFRQVVRNRWAVGALALVILLQLAAVYTPALARVLRVVPLTLGEWGLVLPLAIGPAVIGQLLRLHRGGFRLGARGA